MILHSYYIIKSVDNIGQRNEYHPFLDLDRITVLKIWKLTKVPFRSRFLNLTIALTNSFKTVSRYLSISC
ncbi:hypothetical protein RRG08_011326 [Elysia crispata]|uniref:Uncharacterized protein n=1 Tax=Elysia crispata TaxID=231223 RepID=A0AAE0YCI8_9GAST|nr:hypothetical protein RRG08_011326 [Elysia crispata]